MFSKLVSGELSLAATFWKFGILGLLINKLAIKIFGIMLAGHLKGVTIADFFLHHFHPLYTSKLSILWTLCYVSSVLILVFYTFNIIPAVWRSSAAYDKSIWLRYLARLFFLIFVVVIYASLNLSPLLKV